LYRYKSESWRLRKSKYCKNRLSTLDYRCHVGPSVGRLYTFNPVVTHSLKPPGFNNP
jgi:hypothetical protein